jgi:hypothetical protein
MANTPFVFEHLPHAPMPDIWSKLRHQSLGRALTPAERAFADALEASFARGTHDFAAVCADLRAAKVAGPSSGRTDWTPATLEAELSLLNADLDGAYAAHGLGA